MILHILAEEAAAARSKANHLNRELEREIVNQYRGGATVQQIWSHIDPHYTLSFVVKVLMIHVTDDDRSALLGCLDPDDGSGIPADQIAGIIGGSPAPLIDIGAIVYVRSGNRWLYKLTPGFAARLFPANPNR